MAGRATWKGVLKLAELQCGVALYPAVSASSHLVLHAMNRATGHRLHRAFIDPATDRPVARADQVKGYTPAEGETVVLEPGEVAAVVPESDKTLTIATFIPCAEIDPLYFDRPYHLAPAGPADDEGYALLGAGMRRGNVAAVARAVLFRRERRVLIRPHGAGLLAVTLRAAAEVRDAAEAFGGLADRPVAGEMRELAEHIIRTKSGRFDPATFTDRYEAALAALVKAKEEGRPLPAARPAPAENVVDLMTALRQSAEAGAQGGGAKGGAAKMGSAKVGSPRPPAPAKPRRRAG